MTDKIFWLTRRLKELGKTKVGLADELGVGKARFSDLETGHWKIQTHQIKKVAEYLEFDRTALLDFLSGDITEEELWKHKPDPKISAEDIALLNAVKSIAIRPAAEKETSNNAKSPEIPPKKERER